MRLHGLIRLTARFNRSAMCDSMGIYPTFLPWPLQPEWPPAHQFSENPSQKIRPKQIETSTFSAIIIISRHNRGLHSRYSLPLTVNHINTYNIKRRKKNLFN
jgi:hypothetical protein